MTGLLFRSINDDFFFSCGGNAMSNKGNVVLILSHLMTPFQRYAFCITGSNRTMIFFVLQFIYHFLKVGQIAQSV